MNPVLPAIRVQGASRVNLTQGGKGVSGLVDHLRAVPDLVAGPHTPAVNVPRSRSVTIEVVDVGRVLVGVSHADYRWSRLSQT